MRIPVLNLVFILIGLALVSCDEEVDPELLPVVSTTEVTSISYNSAQSGGEVTDNGGSEVISRGVCWSTSLNPTISLNTKTVDGSGTGSFISSITGLLSGSTYYLRAYATNSFGTTYGKVFSFSTAVHTVTSTTGKVWMDRNLGASRVAISSTDAEAYGDLYQWGRVTDGHEKRNSQTTFTLSSSDTPGHGSFITVNNLYDDWRSLQNDYLWQGINGTNNPCPEGFRIPTKAEWQAEVDTWGNKYSSGAFASPLKLTVAGYRSDFGSLNVAGFFGGYWSATMIETYAYLLSFNNGINASMDLSSRANGFSVRCIKD